MPPCYKRNPLTMREAEAVCAAWTGQRSSLFTSPLQAQAAAGAKESGTRSCNPPLQTLPDSEIQTLIKLRVELEVV